MVLIREVEGRWAAEMKLDKPLEFGLLLVVQPGSLTFVKEGIQRPSGHMVCQVAYWRTYAYMEMVVDEVTVQLVPNGERLVPRLTRVALWLQRRPFWLKQFVQREAVIANVSNVMATACTVSLLALLWMLFDHRQWLWVFAGRSLRTAGSLGILYVFVYLFPVRLGLYKGSGILNRFYLTMLLYVGFVAWSAWLQFARLPPDYKGTGVPDVDLAQYVAGRLGHTYWPVLLAALPWAALILRAFGFEIAGKTADEVRKAAKD